jgi:hypothetical protein
VRGCARRSADVFAQRGAGQEQGRGEAFGGFSYLWADTGDPGFEDGANGPGFLGEIAVFANDWFGVGAEVGLNAGDVDVPVIQVFPTPDVDFTQWTFLVGPRFRLVTGDRSRFGAQAMVGLARADIDVEFDPAVLPIIDEIDLTVAGFDDPETAFGASFGVHFDLDVGERLVWRVVQPDLLITTYGDDTQTHVRVASGLGVIF